MLLTSNFENAVTCSLSCHSSPMHRLLPAPLVNIVGARQDAHATLIRFAGDSSLTIMVTSTS